MVVMVRGDGHVMVVMVRGHGFELVSHAETEALSVPRRIYSPSGQAAAERVLLRHGCDDTGMIM